MLGGKAPSVDKELDRRLVHARLGGARLSRRALRAGAGAVARASDGHARHGQRRASRRFRSTGRWSNRRRRRWRACASRERAYTLLKIRGAQRGDRGLGRLAARRTGHGAGVRGGERRQSRHHPRAGVLHLRRLLHGRCSITCRPSPTRCRRRIGCSARRRSRRRSSSNTRSLFPDILDLYGKDFVAAWNVALGNLQLRPLLADKPKYLALSAASAPTSPIKQIFESVRDETALTRERKAPPSANGAAEQAKTTPPSARRLQTLSATKRARRSISR